MNEYDPRNPSTRNRYNRDQSEDYSTPDDEDRFQADRPRQTGSGWQSGEQYGSTYQQGTENAYPRYSSRYRQSTQGEEYGGNRGETGYGQSRYDRGSSHRGHPRGYTSNYRSRSWMDEDFEPFTGDQYGGRDFYASRRPAPTGLSSTRGYGATSRSADYDYGSWREYGEQRGFLERAGDEIASWFGDEDAARRREMDHAGKGPSDYTRSDERIREDVNDRLTHDRAVDASRIAVRVSDGEVTLDGNVDDRYAKRQAEDLADRVSGVKHVQNNLRVQPAYTAAASGSTFTGQQAGTDANRNV